MDEQDRWNQFILVAKNKLNLSDIEFSKFQHIIQFIESNNIKYPTIGHTEDYDDIEYTYTYFSWCFESDRNNVCTISILKDGKFDYFIKSAEVVSTSEIPCDELPQSVLDFILTNFKKNE